MIRHHLLPLTFSADQVQSLDRKFQALRNFVERQRSLKVSDYNGLLTELTEIVKTDPAWQELLQQFQANKQDYFHVTLHASNPNLLHLPWELAVANTIPADADHLFLSRSTDFHPDGTTPKNAGPLKILIMFSLPSDLEPEALLKLDQEEAQLITALAPLYASGNAQIDFTFNGSLEALREKIKLNDYHIVHFSGHGAFDTELGDTRTFPHGRLLLQDPLTFQHKEASGEDFAKALQKPNFTVPLVFLSACQTATGDIAANQHSVCQALFERGIPAVISMSMSISDKWAAEFAATFYHNLAHKKPLAEAFAATKTAIQKAEAQWLLQKKLPMLPLQWLIPQLYLQQNVEPVNWQQTPQPLQTQPYTLRFANRPLQVIEARIKRKDEDGYQNQFIGRNRDFGRIIPLLQQHQPILIQGQGGLGKTRIAKKIAERLKLAQPELAVFLFNENGTNFSQDILLDDLETYFADTRLLEQKPYRRKNNREKLQSLLAKITPKQPTLFIFDNCETFQGEQPGLIQPEWEWLVPL